MNGNPERDVDGVLECDGLDRDQRLVVIHADRAVIGFARGGVEHGVRRQRAANRDALGAQGFDGRRDDVEIFGAERAVFAGMRVEAGDDEARMGEAETGLQIPDHDAGGRDDQFARQLRERLAQRQMDRHRHHGKRRRPQHHHRLRDAAAIGGQLGEKFGVAGMAEACAVKHVLGDRIGDDGAGLAGGDVADRKADGGQRSFRAGLVRHPGLGGCRLAGRNHRQRAPKG